MTTHQPLQTGIARPPWLPETVWPFQLRTITVDGCRLHLIDEGTGPVLLLVHAGMWSFVWRDLIADLARDFRCVAVDFPRSGLTQAPAGYPIGLASNARLLEGVVDQLGLTEVTLVAHDLGGLIGLGWAAHDPDPVRGLVLLNTFGWPPQPALQAMLKLMGSPAMRALNTATNLVPRLTSRRFGVGRHLGRQARRAFLGPTQERTRRRSFHQLMADASRSTRLLEQVEAALRTSLRDRPVLTVFGQYNDPFHFQQRWRELYPHARQVVVPHGNHFPMNDDPQGVAAAIRSWWQDNSEAGPEAVVSAALVRRAGGRDRRARTKEALTKPQSPRWGVIRPESQRGTAAMPVSNVREGDLRRKSVTS